MGKDQPQHKWSCSENMDRCVSIFMDSKSVIAVSKMDKMDKGQTVHFLLLGTREGMAEGRNSDWVICSNVH